MMISMEQFLALERVSRDSIDVKKVYIHMAGDLVAGVLLSQIVFWFLPGPNGSKLRVKHKGFLWLVKARTDWYDEVCLTPKQVDRALRILQEKGLVEVELMKFNGAPTSHIRINWPTFLEEWGKWNLPKGENGIYPKGKMEFDQRANSLTETTTETTSDSDDAGQKRKEGKTQLQKMEAAIWDAFPTFPRKSNQSLVRSIARDLLADGFSPDDVSHAPAWLRSQDWYQDGTSYTPVLLRKHMPSIREYGQTRSAPSRVGVVLPPPSPEERAAYLRSLEENDG